MVSKIYLQTCKSEFVSHWVPHSFGLVIHLSKTLSKLLPVSRYKFMFTPSIFTYFRFCLSSISFLDSITFTISLNLFFPLHTEYFYFWKYRFIPSVYFSFCSAYFCVKKTKNKKTPNPFLYKYSVLFQTIQFSMSKQFNCQKHFYFK